MGRHDELKKLDLKTRNQLRQILRDGGSEAIPRLIKLRGRLGKQQTIALEGVLGSPLLKGVRSQPAFPKRPSFADNVHASPSLSLGEVLRQLDHAAKVHGSRLLALGDALSEIDTYLPTDLDFCVELLEHAIVTHGWSHALLRRLVLVRELLPDANEKIETLVRQAGLQANAVVVTSLVHVYSPEQNYLTTKRSILNILDRGSINRYSRTLARIAAQPFAKDGADLASMLIEAEKCSLIDPLILCKFNWHFVHPGDFPHISRIASHLGRQPVFDALSALYPLDDDECEHVFYKQSSAWLEYEAVRNYRILIDAYYDASYERLEEIPGALKQQVNSWVGEPKLEDLVSGGAFTKHNVQLIRDLEIAGRVTRSAIFNYWLHTSEGQIGFDREQLLTLMGLTRDLARTVPITATRTASKLTQDKLVRLILLLLLAKRSKNEMDNFQLRKLLAQLSIKEHEGSILRLVESYEKTHPYVAEYIYDIATEDFLAKLNKLAPHLADIPEIRASLHEWMARHTGNEHYLERARTVRIDHQLNRIRNEIDDHRIYVDPSRFSSWIEDEMMIELTGALATTGSGKKGATVSWDEATLTLVMRECYSAFCSNAVFGIESYIGRRIRHGTFHGHLYSSIVNAVQSLMKYAALMKDSQFLTQWNAWKASYNKVVSQMVAERLHVQSRVKPLGLLQPEVYGPHKQDILSAAVATIGSAYAEAKTTNGLIAIITDYCWRLAEVDLAVITNYLKSQKEALKHVELLDAAVGSVSIYQRELAAEFKRDLIRGIDNKLAAMYGWFKRPSNVAPKASLALLYDAVVGEVKDSVPTFDPQTDASPHGDFEIVGGGYHIMYDSLAVVVSNAAKYGDPSKPVRREFSLVNAPDKKLLIVEIASSIRPDEDPADVARVIEQRKTADFGDANMYQGRSGIPKLMQLANIRNDFKVEFLGVVEKEVRVRFSYVLEH